MVALTAGDPAFADELASRAFGSGGEGAAAIAAIAKLRQDDRGGLRRLLDRVDQASGPWPYWRRLVVESAALGWLPETLAVRRLMRRGGLPAPGVAGLMVRALPPPTYMGSLITRVGVGGGGGRPAPIASIACDSGVADGPSWARPAASAPTKYPSGIRKRMPDMACQSIGATVGGY